MKKLAQKHNVKRSYKAKVLRDARVIKEAKLLRDAKVEEPEAIPTGEEKNVSASYNKLQSIYKEVYSKATKENNEPNLEKLKDYRKALSERVQEYQKNPSTMPDLLDEISRGFTLLGDLNKPVKTEQPQVQEKPSEPTQSLKQTPVVKEKPLTREIIPVKTKPSSGTLVETYKIEVDGAKVDIELRKEEFGITYGLFVPEINIATSALLNDIREELVSITTVSMQELVDPKSFSAIKARFIKEAEKIIRKKLPNIEEETEKFLVGHLIQEMLGLGKIEFLINDGNLEEIVITSSKEPIRVYSRKYGWLITNIVIEREEDIINYSNIIARRVGRQINVLNPLLDAHLVTGDRINAVLYPINTKGNTITIRKFARDPFTIVDMINTKTCDLDIASLLWLGMEYEMNIIISGGTASGKTSFLNCCMPFIPPNHRIISIEDTRELMLPEFLYWTPLVTRLPNPEGKGGVSMLDLLVNSLRMRPDRIILGEMRRHEEAMVLFEAMHTGHSVYATLHADSAPETISRLINPPISVPANLLKSVHLNVVMFRDRRRGFRRISQVAEIEVEGDSAKANVIFRWLPDEDRIIRHSQESMFMESISRHTGMTDTEIKSDLNEKKEILQWMIKNGIRDLGRIGLVMESYYKNREVLFKAIKRNDLSIIAQRTRIEEKK